MGCSSILYRPLEACQVKYTILGQIKEMITPDIILGTVLDVGSIHYNADVLTMIMAVDTVLSDVDLEQLLEDNNNL